MIFLGRELPPPRRGCQWVMQIYPGGRRVVVEAKPYRVSVHDDALAKLKTGHRVYVGLNDAISVLRLAKLPSISER